MKISADRKFTLTTISLVCFATYLFFGGKFLDYIAPDFGEDFVNILGLIFFWGMIIFGCLLSWHLLNIYENNGNQGALVKTAIIGALIIPLLIGVFFYFGTTILIGAFLFIGVTRLL
jgi:hypothetical protein